MRVTAGIFRGRLILFPKAIRPTRDLVRAAIFNVLGDIEGLRVLDLYAGSGALGIEAISRGAVTAEFVEEEEEVSRILEKNIKNFGIESKTKIVFSDVGRYLENISGQTLGKAEAGPQYDLVFADPPYKLEMGELVGIIEMVGKILKQGGIFVLEQSSRRELSEVSELKLIKSKKYGDTQIGFYKKP